MKVKPHTIQMLQAISGDHTERGYEFCSQVFNCMEEDDDVISKFIFSDEATVHLH